MFVKNRLAMILAQKCTSFDIEKTDRQTNTETKSENFNDDHEHTTQFILKCLVSRIEDLQYTLICCAEAIINDFDCMISSFLLKWNKIQINVLLKWNEICSEKKFWFHSVNGFESYWNSKSNDRKMRVFDKKNVFSWNKNSPFSSHYKSKWVLLSPSIYKINSSLFTI